MDNPIYKSRLKRRGVRILSINEPTDDSPAGQFMEGIIEEAGAFYSANLAQEVKTGNAKLPNAPTTRAADHPKATS